MNFSIVSNMWKPVWRSMMMGPNWTGKFDGESKIFQETVNLTNSYDSNRNLQSQNVKCKFHNFTPAKKHKIYNRQENIAIMIQLTFLVSFQTLNFMFLIDLIIYISIYCLPTNNFTKYI